MRNLYERTVNSFRVKSHLGWGDETCGSFMIPSLIDSAPMYVIASSGGGWDHVSVSRKNRCPNWPEMESVRDLFFEPHETVLQYSVPRADHINFASTYLHMPRPQEQEIPRPPAWMVGPAEGETVEECLAKARDAV